MTQPANELVVREPSAMEMLGTIATSSEITLEKVAMAERLAVVRREMRAEDSKEAFYRAFIAMRKDMPQVQALKEVEGRYKFAPFEHIRKIADPILARNGFAVSFDTKTEDTRLTSICTLIHEAGHSVSNQFSCRFSKPPGTNDSQGDMATRSYAMRGAFCDAVGIVIDKDTDGTDARGLGHAITPEQADDLEKRMIACGRDRAKFLSYAEAERFAQIDEAGYARCDAMLRKAEKSKPKPAAPPEEEEERNPDGSFKF